MQHLATPTCRCTHCPGATCTCGCKSPAAPQASAACRCGPNCACQPGCRCAHAG